MKTVKIKGMSCNHCVMAVKKALEDMDGVHNIDVNLEKGAASFEEVVPVEIGAIKEKIKKAGYEIG